MKKSLTIITASVLALSSMSLLGSATQKVKASDSTDIVKTAEKLAKHSKYSIAPEIRETGNHKSTSFLIKKYHLKKYTIPKKFRGTWYSKKLYVKISAHSIKGNGPLSGLVTQIYRGSMNLNDSINQKYGMQKNVYLAWPYKKHSLTVTVAGSQPFGFTRMTNHGHKALMVESPHSVYYTNRKLSYKLSSTVDHEIQF